MPKGLLSRLMNPADAVNIIKKDIKDKLTKGEIETPKKIKKEKVNEEIEDIKESEKVPVDVTRTIKRIRAGFPDLKSIDIAVVENILNQDKTTFTLDDVEEGLKTDLGITRQKSYLSLERVFKSKIIEKTKRSFRKDGETNPNMTNVYWFNKGIVVQVGDVALPTDKDKESSKIDKILDQERTRIPKGLMETSLVGDGKKRTNNKEEDIKHIVRKLPDIFEMFLAELKENNALCRALYRSKLLDKGLPRTKHKLSEHAHRQMGFHEGQVRKVIINWKQCEGVGEDSIATYLEKYWNAHNMKLYADELDFAPILVHKMEESTEKLLDVFHTLNAFSKFMHGLLMEKLEDEEEEIPLEELPLDDTAQTHDMGGSRQSQRADPGEEGYEPGDNPENDPDYNPEDNLENQL